MTMHKGLYTCLTVKYILSTPNYQLPNTSSANYQELTINYKVQLSIKI